MIALNDVSLFYLQAMPAVIGRIKDNFTINLIFHYTIHI